MERVNYICVTLALSAVISGCSIDKKSPQVESSSTTISTKNDNKENYNQYEVISGDTIFNISKKFNISQEQLKEWNPTIDYENLKVGDKLKISSVILDNLEKDKVDFKKGFTYEKISSDLEKKINGNSYNVEAPVSINDLRYVKVLHNDIDGNTKTGELIVNKYIAQDMVEIFYDLYKKGYPIETMELVEEYDTNDELSMSHNNTSAFCYHPIEGTDITSYHSYGLAIDINPLINPYVKDDIVLPNNATIYTDRNKENYNDDVSKMMINSSDYIYDLFLMVIIGAEIGQLQKTINILRN